MPIIKHFLPATYDLMPFTGIKNGSTARKTGWSDCHFFQTFAPPVVQVNELLCIREIADNVKFSDGFLFCGGKGREGVGKAPGIQDVLTPQTVHGEVFQTLCVLDQDVHSAST